jgi:hypothetical protein
LTEALNQSLKQLIPERSVNMKCDLAIAYRIYPKVSKVPFIFPDNKLKLAEVGVQTLKKALGTLSYKVFFLMDNCPPEFEEMILKYFSPGNIEFVRYNGIGNLPSFGKQIDLLLSQTAADVVFFAEDDYVYRRDTLAAAVSVLRAGKADFVTPYDHLDSYILPIHTRHRYEIAIHDGLHWRTSASTCLTFLTTKKLLAGTENTFRSYCSGNWDSSLWFALTKFNVFDLPAIIRYAFTDRFLLKTILLSWIKTFGQTLFGKKYILWQPIPSIATHMESVSIAPNVDWDKQIKE